MDVVLVGLPGSGKSAVGRRLAHRHGATFVDLDDVIEKAAGMAIPSSLAQRLRRSPTVRPLMIGRDPMGAIRDLARERDRFYAAAYRVNGVAELASIVERVDELVARVARDPVPTILLRGRSLGGDLVIGEGIAAPIIADTLRGLRARRAILVSEPGAWAAGGE